MSTITLLVALLSCSHWLTGAAAAAAAEDSSPTRWNRPEQVAVIASKTIRSQSQYHVMLVLANSTQPATFDLKLSGDTVLNKSVLVKPNQSQLVAFQVRDSRLIEALSVQVLAQDGSWRFQQEKRLTQDHRTLSVLLQTDKSLYKPGQVVRFRALFLHRNHLQTPASQLELARAASLVQVSDPQGNLIKQWSSFDSQQGVASFELPLADEPPLGDWSIKVLLEDELVGVKEFSVAEYAAASFDVQLSAPGWAAYSVGGRESPAEGVSVAATVRAHYTYGKPVRGQASLQVRQAEEAGGGSYASSACADIAATVNEFRLYQTLVEGVADFQVSLPRPVEERQFGGCHFELVASVEEEQTGKKYNRSRRLIIHATDIKIEWLIRRPLPPFKPGLNYTTMLQVVHQDGSPLTGGFSEVNTLPLELEYLIHDTRVHTVNLRPVGLRGLVEHTWQVPRLVEDWRTSGRLVAPQSLTVRAKYLDASLTEHLTRSCSASNQLMQISRVKNPRSGLGRLGKRLAAEQKPAAVGEQVALRIDSTQPLQSLVTCHGVSRGSIVWASNLREPQSKTYLEFEVPISANMTPALEVLCFYVNQENQELIADSLKLPVSLAGSGRNFARINLSQVEAEPGQMVELEVRSKPESLIGLLALDQSVDLLKSGNDISREQLEDDAAPADATSFDAFHSTAESLFGRSGTIVMTTSMMQPESAYLKVLPSKLIEEPTLEEMDVEMNVIPATGSPDGDEMLAEESVLAEHVVVAKQELPQVSQKPQVRPRQFLPETWIWANGSADAEGRFRMSSLVPDTLTSYSLSAFSSSHIYGLGLSEEQVNLKVFKQFFVKLHVPPFVIRGETVNIMATVFNYLDEPISAKVALDNRYGDFEFVKPARRARDEEFSSADQQVRRVNVGGGNSRTISFLIRPNQLGLVDLKITASSNSAVDSVVQKLQVKPEGKTWHKNQATLVKLDRSSTDGKFIKNFTLKMPPNAVEGSQKVFVSMIGEPLGLSLKNVKNLLRMPYGCGEQNMINLLPNLVILKYLEASGRVEPTTRTMALTNIEKAYQRQLKFRRSDGSFSPFGDSDATGSVWLTAYVLRGLQQAKSLIKVDERLIEGAVEYLTRFSQEDGSMAEVGMIHNQELKSTTYLTAHSVIALLQATNLSDSYMMNEVESRLEQVIGGALGYLEGQLELVITSGSIYELSIIDYTLHLGNRLKSAQRAHQELWRRRRESQGLIWWDADRKRPAQQPTTNSLSIEMTAFALMTLVRRGELEQAAPVAKWLVGNQNSHGGFISTQDTVLAIEALAAFVAASASGPTSMSIKLLYPQSTSNYLNMQQYQIEPDSSMVLQKTQLPAGINWVQVEATGSGVGIVQVSWQYNLLETKLEKPAFQLRANMELESTQNRMNLRVCSRYKAGKASNMAVVDVKLPSGYSLDVEAMKQLQGVGLVKKVEFFNHDSRVELYFDELTRVETCIPVVAYRTWKVSNNKPGSVGVYDYYDRRRAARITYRPKPSSSCDICELDSCSSGCRKWKKSAG